MLAVSILLHKSITDVTRRKGRATFMILGILCGVLGLTAVNIANDRLGEAFTFESGLGTAPDLVFRTTAIPDTDRVALAGIQGVTQVQIRQEYRTRWHLAKSHLTATIQVNAFANFQQINMRRFQILAGHAPGPGEIVVDTQNNKVQPVTIGETIVLERQDGTLISLRVVGLTRTTMKNYQNSSLQATAYMSTAGLEQIAPAPAHATTYVTGTVPPDRSSAIFVKIAHADDAAQVIQTFENNIKQTGRSVIDYKEEEEHGANARQAVDGLLGVIRALAGIALILSGLLIVNMITALLTEQVKIIGTMKALGGTRWRIIGSYLFSVSIYSIAGTLPGIVLGVVAGNLLSMLFAEATNTSLGPFVLSPLVFLTSVFIGLLVPLLSALIPLWTGTGMTVREAISTYGVNAKAGQFFARGKRSTILPQIVYVGLHGIFRKPGRACMTLCALIFSTSAFIAVQITNTSIGASLEAQANVYHNDDTIFVGVNPLPMQSVLEIVRSVQGIERVETLDEESLTTTKGTLWLVGLTPETQLYHPQVTSGRWLATNDTNKLVMSDYAAQQLSLRVGDTFSMSQVGDAPPLPHPLSYTVIGIVHELNHVTSGTGTSRAIGTAFMPMESLNTLRHASPGTAKHILVRTHDHSLQAVQETDRQILQRLDTAGLKGVRSKITQISVKNQQTNILLVFALFSAVAIIISLVGLLSLANTLSASVLERQQEIGILRSLGATSWRVGTVFWIEGITLSVIAWSLGILSGFPGAAILLNVLGNALMPFDYSFSPLLVPFSLLFVIIIASIASLGPALRAAHMRIQEILRYE
jgi:putative ABC transport system permease protein